MLKNKILQEDIELMAKQLDYNRLSNSTILITGASGLIGSQIILLLDYLNTTKNLKIKILALGRNLNKLQQKFSKVQGIEYIEADVLNPIIYRNNIDYIIHCASVTQSQDFVLSPVNTILTTIEGTKNLLFMAKDKNIKGFVYLSSMEVFGQVTESKKLKETDLGYIDLTNIRSSYSESKRMAELLCLSFAKQYNLPIMIARLAQTIGPGFKYDDNRMSIQFAKAVIENHNIVLLTEGNSSFCSIYIRDAIMGIFTILLKGKTGDCYNVANSSTYVSVKDIASMIVNEIAHNKINIEYKLNKTDKYPPTFYLNLDTSKLNNLGWSAEVNLQEMYERLITSLKGFNND